MSNLTQFTSSAPVGTIIQSPANISDPNWLRCDGSIITRAAYPALSAAMPGVGTFMPTVRAATPYFFGAASTQGPCIASNGTNMICLTSTTGNNSIMISTNYGVTWAAVTSGISSTYSFSGTALAGANFVAGVCNALCQPGYASASAPATWTLATGVTLSGSGSSTIAASAAGSVVMCYGGQGWVSTNSGVSYSVSTGLLLLPAVNPPIVWTGTQFIAFTAGITNGLGYQYSATGAASSWSTAAIVPWGYQLISGACSDGAGNVLVVIANSSIAWVSSNGGTSWRETLLPFAAAGSCSYANGRWFVPMYVFAGAYYADGSVAVSADTYTWFLVPSMACTNTSANSSSNTVIAYAGGNYCALNNAGNGNVPVTSTEVTTQMYLPNSRRSGFSGASGSYQLISAANWQEWIKVQ